MLETPPPASRQELIDQYRAGAGRGDWRTMLAARQELAIRDEYDIAAEIRRAQAVLTTATTRLEAAHTELGMARRALADGRDTVPLAAEQATVVASDPRSMARVTAAAAYVRDALPKLEQATAAAERRCQENAQSVSEAQARLDRLLTAAYARVPLVANADRRLQP